MSSRTANSVVQHSTSSTLAIKRISETSLPFNQDFQVMLMHLCAAVYLQNLLACNVVPRDEVLALNLSFCFSNLAVYFIFEPSIQWNRATHSLYNVFLLAFIDLVVPRGCQPMRRF